MRMCGGGRCGRLQVQQVPATAARVSVRARPNARTIADDCALALAIAASHSSMLVSPRVPAIRLPIIHRCPPAVCVLGVPAGDGERRMTTKADEQFLDELEFTLRQDRSEPPPESRAPESRRCARNDASSAPLAGVRTLFGELKESYDDYARAIERLLMIVLWLSPRLARAALWLLRLARPAARRRRSGWPMGVRLRPRRDARRRAHHKGILQDKTGRPLTNPSAAQRVQGGLLLRLRVRRAQVWRVVEK